jgi:hypothetical protein
LGEPNRFFTVLRRNSSGCHHEMYRDEDRRQKSDSSRSEASWRGAEVVELVFSIAAGIVVGFVILAFLGEIFVGFVKALGYVLAAALIICAIVLGIELVTYVFSSVWTLLTIALVAGFAIFVYFVERSAVSSASRDQRAFRKFCATKKLGDVFGDVMITSNVDVTLDEQARKFVQCSYQLQARLYKQWIAIDGGESYKLIEAKAMRLSEAARARKVSRELQGARIVAFDQDRHEQPMKEFYFPDKWGW